MTTLKLFLENDGRSWTLRPNREYIIGSGSDCQISLPEEGIASQQLKFNFNPRSKLWYFYNLDESIAIYINNQPLTEYPITNQVRISVGNSLVFVAMPEGSQPSVMAQSEPSVIHPLPNSSATYGRSLPPQSMNDTRLKNSAIVRYINRFFLDKEDPEELRGIWLRNFCFSFNQNLALQDKSSKQRIAFKDQFKLKIIREDLYKEIDIRLREYQEIDPYLNKQLRFKVVDYKDCKYEYDRERLYIEIVRDTIRKTKITTLLRFFVNGDNLYVSADSYALGKLSKIKLIIHSVIIFIFVIFVFSVMLGIASGNLFIQLLTGLSLIQFIPLIILYLYLFWIKFIRVLLQGDSFRHALRVNFPIRINNGLDADDISMFLKSIYPLIISSLEEVLLKHGFLDEDLIEVLKGIRNNIGQTINVNNVNTGGGSIFGAIFGGSNNSIKNL